MDAPYPVLFLEWLMLYDTIPAHMSNLPDDSRHFQCCYKQWRYSGDLIQACIFRIAQNSFLIRGWAITLVAAFAALTVEKLNLYVLCGVGIVILLVFWYLDAFFLRMEKLYRFKYEWVIAERPKGNREYLYDLNPYQNKTRMAGRKSPSVISVMFSKPHTLFISYGCPILIGVITIIISLAKCFG